MGLAAMAEWSLIAVTPIFFIFGVLLAEHSKVRTAAAASVWNRICREKCQPQNSK
jgi:hypothetical protein